MRKLLAVIAILQLAIASAAAQSQSAAKAETLSLEQKTKLSQLISTRVVSISMAAPLAAADFATFLMVACSCDFLRARALLDPTRK